MYGINMVSTERCDSLGERGGGVDATGTVLRYVRFEVRHEWISIKSNAFQDDLFLMCYSII